MPPTTSNPPSNQVEMQEKRVFEIPNGVVAHHIHIKTDAVLMDEASLDILSLSLELMALCLLLHQPMKPPQQNMRLH
jgi:hypothetical protein